MKNKLKIYVWHTPKIIEYINILKKSAQEFDDVEIISVIGNESVDTNLSMGQTSSDSYKNLMLHIALIVLAPVASIIIVCFCISLINFFI